MRLPNTLGSYEQLQRPNMDIKQLIEKMDQFAGQAVGQKPGDQWRGTDKGTPGKKLVGGDEQQEESVLKDLSKGPTPKTQEQELAEEWATFSEENIGTHPKRPGRKSDRHSRGHEPHPRYKTIKADEGAMGDKDIELQDYRSMSHKEFQTAYGMTKTEWISKNKSLVITNPNIKKGLGLDEAGNPAQQAAIAIAMKKAGKKPKNEGVSYKTANPHPASKDPIVAKVLKQMRPGLTGLDMNNEAFLYFAYEIGKMRAREMWEDYGPAIKHFYQSGIGVNEGWESGPEEYEEPYDDADDAYDRQRQSKLDAETEAEWAKKPKKTTYKLTGRGPNMEPNHEFGGEFSDLNAAKEYRRQLMTDPDTPHPEHIGIRTIERVIDEAVTPPGSGVVKNINDYIRRRDEIFKALADPKQRDNYPWYKQALFDLNRMAKQAGIKIEESRAHKQLATWFKNRELAQKYASGEVKIPTPQERKAELEKFKKEKVDEYGANNPPQGTTITTPTTPQKVDPKQAQQVAQNLNVQKTALGQLKQLNPDINPQKAALAATKDLATMNPQEKEVLAQVAKTLSPALGSPAFGSIKTALQKAKNI